MLELSIARRDKASAEHWSSRLLASHPGDLWALGQVPIAAEHLASEVVLHVLKGGLRMSRGTGPLVVCGCLKIGYDLALLRMFRHTKPPEEI